LLNLGERFVGLFQLTKRDMAVFGFSSCGTPWLTGSFIWILCGGGTSSQRDCRDQIGIGHAMSRRASRDRNWRSARASISGVSMSCTRHFQIDSAGLPAKPSIALHQQDCNLRRVYSLEVIENPWQTRDRHRTRVR